MRRVLLVCLGVTLTALAIGKWARPISAPLARLLSNAEAAVKANPKSATAHYLDGRLRSLAYASDAKMVDVYDPDKDLKFPPYGSVLVPYARPSGPLTGSAKAHLISSVGHYARACELDPKSGLYQLGYGWMLEQASRWVMVLPKSATGWPSETSAGGWIKAAAGAYRKAYDLTKDEDAKLTHRFGGADSIVSLEALDNLRRLSAAKKITLDPAFKNEMLAHEKLIAKKPMMVSPIVFPLAASTPLSSIDNPKAKVKFDLDGAGAGRKWTWITPRAAFLVWNPLGDGKVESGREMFGNATFWMFFRNGYDALAALDDNQDGELKGPEMRFIAVWRDANSNAASDPGEVRPLASYGVKAIRTRPDGKLGSIWFKRAGLVRTDGSVLPTYDWMAKRR